VLGLSLNSPRASKGRPSLPDPQFRLVHRSLVLLASLFGLFLCVLAGLAILGLGLQSSVRAYVGGEGLRSKSQKDAALDLSNYLTSGDEEAFRSFERNLRVPLGDRRARETLEEKHPDLSIARRGFLEGRNDPADIDDMIALFRRFRSVPELDRAIAIWAQGDRLIEEMRGLAHRIHARSPAGPLATNERDAFRRELERLNARLTALEDEFSRTLGDAARRVHALLVGVIVGIALLLAGIAAVAAWQIAMLLGRKEAAARASERRYRELFERSPAGLYRTSFDGRLLECNAALADLLGYGSREEVLQLSASDLYVDPADRQTFLASLRDRRVLMNCEVRLKRRDGTSLWALLNKSVLSGQVQGEEVMEGSVIDITARKEAEEDSHHRAYHDPLTELPNRALVRDRLGLILEQGKRRRQMISVMFVDLDHFKRVNDLLGHAGGDELLIQAAQRLKACVRAEDTVARFGGDEFLLLLSNERSRETGVTPVAVKILKVFSEPFRVRGRELVVSASMGISVYPDDGKDVDTLVANADRALYRAKDLGRNNFQYFTSQFQEASQRRAVLEAELQRALHREEFVVHYQPVVQAVSRTVISVEALVRWCPPGKPMRLPAEFIPVAEELGVIAALGEWVLRQSCRQAATWRAQGARELRLSVNLSGHQLEDRQLSRLIARVLGETDLPAAALELELTESSALERLKPTRELLGEIAALGASISLDEFGAGHASLSSLRTFPLNRLKIDRSFVDGMTKDVRHRELVAGIVTIAHNLDLEVTADGVETEEQAGTLERLGCDAMQGHLLGRPMAADQMAGLLLAG
jgi:diguanylate cyclase (GGDEF)-like protein/PAS domain S-box-containing protein